MPLGGYSCEHGSSHSVYQGYAADDQAASQALVDKPVADALARIMVPGNQ